MQTTSRLPCVELRGHIRRYLIVRHEAACADAHLPETGVLSAFVLRGECRLGGREPVAAASVTGITPTLRRHTHLAGNAVAIVAFTPAGAAAWGRTPLEEIAGRTVPLDEWDGAHRDWQAEVERLRAEPNDARRFDRLDDIFRAVLTAPIDPLLAAATAWLAARPGEARVAELVRHIGLSQSALERRFRRGVGATPKTFARLVRFRAAAACAGAAAGELTTVAHAAGYADQAHFTRECQRITGAPPSRFFAEN
ncbi:MAG: helix-turn-helix domain-containing protein [Candidatus Didemnitutus sp.]|nr:helix-turn-helix domain-containing protein [Candidatus Didemnitutus sp.]